MLSMAPHGLAHLAQHPVGRDPGHANLLGQAQGRQSGLIAGHQIDGQELLYQRQVSGVKECARRH